MTQTTWIILEIFAGIALLMVLTAFLTRWFSPPPQRGPADLLKERYARGELSRAEYQRTAKDLGIVIPSDSDLSEPPDLPDAGTGSITGHAHGS